MHKGYFLYGRTLESSREKRRLLANSADVTELRICG